MAILILAEHADGHLSPATLATIGAARALSEKGAGDIAVLVAGSDCAAAGGEAATVPGVNKVLVADDAAYGNGLAENVAGLIVALAPGYSHVLAPATTYGKNICPRAAALLDSQQVSEITDVVDSETFVRPIYAGNALATVRCKDAIKVITVRATAFEKAAPGDGGAAIESVSGPGDAGLSTHAGAELSHSERPELTAARVIISGGRGMQSGDNFKQLEEIADILGAAVGASRAAVDAGFVPNDFRSARPARSSRPSFTSLWAFPARSSISRA